MKSKKNSFLDFRHFERRDLVSLFQVAESLRHQKEIDWKFQGTAALLFFENSTRTRMSFESASWRVGLGPILLDINSGSSLTKGETAEDTILNVAAMDPKVLIVRCGSAVDLEELDQQVDAPIVNAGWGSKAHPSQALLDLYTLWKERELDGTKLLIVGDILHSRVASSHFEIFKKMGVQVAVCGPALFKPDSSVSDLKWFDHLEEGLQWCDAVMALRLQLERHRQDLRLNPVEYHKAFGLNGRNLSYLRSQGLILHPGPVNRGVELSDEVFHDSRCRIFNQVNSGLYIRMALLKRLLEQV